MKAIDEVWEKHKEVTTISPDRMFKSQFEQAVNELLKLQREECQRAYCNRSQWEYKIAEEILNSEIE